MNKRRPNPSSSLSMTSYGQNDGAQFVSTIRVCFVYYVFFLASGCDSYEVGQPGLTIEGEALHMFGECRQGETLNHTFILRNRSNRPVHVVEFRSSCSCAVPIVANEAKKMRLMPQGTLKVPVQFAIGSRQETASARVLAFYQFEGMEARHYIDLSLQADVLPDFQIDPKKIDFGEIEGLALGKSTRTIRVLPVCMGDLNRVLATTKNELFSAQVASKQDGSYTVTIEADTSKLSESELVESSLILETNSERAPRTVVPIRMKFVAPLLVCPTAVIIDSESVGTITMQVEISTACESRLTVAFNRVEWLQIEADDQLISNQHTIQIVSLPSDNKSLSTQIELQIELFPAGQPSTTRTILVPFHRFTKDIGEES